MSSELYNPNLSASPQIETKQVQVFSENNATYLQKQKVIIQVPPEIQFFDPANSYLQVSLNFDNDATGDKLNVPIVLDETGGLNSCFSRCTIYAGNDLLEDIQGYNYYSSFLGAYTNSPAEANKKSITEGLEPIPKENSKQFSSNIFLQSYSDQGGVNTAKESLTQNLNCKLNTALFNSHKVYANMLAPLRVELTLANNVDVATVIPPLQEGNDTLKLHAQVAQGATQYTIKTDIGNGVDAKFGIKNCPISVGNVLRITGGGNTQNLTVTAIDINGGRFRFTANAVVPANFPADSVIDMQATNYKINMQMKNVALSISQVMPPQPWIDRVLQMVASPQGYNFDVSSILNVQVSKQSGERNIVLYVPTNANRARSIICVPVRTDTANTFIAKPAIRGNYDRYSRYSFFYQSGQHPSEQVPLVRYGGNFTEAEHVYELEKSLKVAGYEVSNLTNLVPLPLNGDRQNWAIGRALSIGNASISLNNRDLQLKIEVDNNNGLERNTLYNFYIHAVRRIKVDMKGSRVIM